MTQAQREKLDAIIAALETVQAAAPTKTTYTMGRADHSISHALLDIIRNLKALANEPVESREPEPEREIITGDTRLTNTEVINAGRKAGK